MVYVFLADGFETVEALCPVDVMRRAGLELKTVSVTEELTVQSRQGVRVICDALLEDVSLEGAQLLFLPGGMPGADNLANSAGLCELLVDANERGVLLAAICAAPYVLGQLGILEGKRATCYPGFEDRLTGAVIDNKKVVIDKNCITGAGMGVSLEFALAIVSTLCSPQKAEEIRSSVLAD